MDLATILTDLRKNKGISRRELSYLCDVSEPSLLNYENGIHSPSVFILSKILAVYNKEVKIL